MSDPIRIDSYISPTSWDDGLDWDNIPSDADKQARYVDAIAQAITERDQIAGGGLSPISWGIPAIRPDRYLSYSTFAYIHASLVKLVPYYINHLSDDHSWLGPSGSGFGQLKWSGDSYTVIRWTMGDIAEAAGYSEICDPKPGFISNVAWVKFAYDIINLLLVPYWPYTPGLSGSKITKIYASGYSNPKEYVPWDSARTWSSTVAFSGDYVSATNKSPETLTLTSHDPVIYSTIKVGDYFIDNGGHYGYVTSISVGNDGTSASIAAGESGHIRYYLQLGLRDGSVTEAQTNGVGFYVTYSPQSSVGYNNHIYGPRDGYEEIVSISRPLWGYDVDDIQTVDPDLINNNGFHGYSGTLYLRGSLLPSGNQYATGVIWPTYITQYPFDSFLSCAYYENGVQIWDKAIPGTDYVSGWNKTDQTHMLSINESTLIEFPIEMETMQTSPDKWEGQVVFLAILPTSDMELAASTMKDQMKFSA